MMLIRLVLICAALWPLADREVIAQPDTARVLDLLERARHPSPRTMRGYAHDTALVRQALELAERIGWDKGRFKTHLWAYMAIVDDNFQHATNEELMGHWNVAYDLRHLADPDEIIQLYTIILKHYANTRQLDTALMYLDTMARAADRAPDDHLRKELLYRKAWLLRLAEQWGAAYRPALEATAAADRSGPPALQASCHRLLGMIKGRLGDLDGAAIHFRRAIALADSLGLPEIKGGAHLNWAYALQVKGRWREALDHYRIVHSLAPYVPNAMEFEMAIGHMLVRLDSLDHGERILNDLYRRKVMAGDPYEQEFNTAYALLHLRRGRYPEAIRFARIAFNTTQTDENDVIKRDASRILADAYKALKQPAKAMEWTEVAHQWEDSVNYRQQAHEALRLEMDHEMSVRAEQDSLAHAQELQQLEAATAAQLSRERSRRNLFLLSGGGVFVLSIVLWRRLRRTARSKRRSEAILENILPRDIAEELKAKGRAEARDIDTVTILFTDFKGFTQLSEQLAAQTLLAEVNSCFEAFDHIITAHGGERIKTIGDAYMAAGGLQGDGPIAAVRMVQAALAMQQHMANYRMERVAAGRPYFEMRLGIHTGPVVAGIVGVKKFQYDVWGDTVNTANRMESSGEVGKVNISAATYALVKEQDGLLFTPRGRVQTKGKGEMEMYFVSSSEA